MNATTVNVVRRQPSGDVQRPAVIAPVQLYPKEHGAYAILGVPLASALVIGGMGVVAVLTTVAAIAGFVAHEPLMVALGRRGHRAQSATPQATLRWMLVAFSSGGAAFWLAPFEVRLALTVCLLFAGFAFVMSVAGLHRTLAAQLIDIMSLTLPSSVVLLAGGVHLSLVIRFWFAWVIGRIATTTAVRSTIASQRASIQRHIPRINNVLLAATVASCVVGILSGLNEWIAITPLLGAAIYLRYRPPRIIHLRQLGWALLAVNVFSAIWMIYLCLPRDGGVG
jgi:hypothetical protein